MICVACLGKTPRFVDAAEAPGLINIFTFVSEPSVIKKNYDFEYIYVMLGPCYIMHMAIQTRPFACSETTLE